MFEALCTRSQSQQLPGAILMRSLACASLAHEILLNNLRELSASSWNTFRTWSEVHCLLHQGGNATPRGCSVHDLLQEWCARYDLVSPRPFVLRCWRPLAAAVAKRSWQCLMVAVTTRMRHDLLCYEDGAFAEALAVYKRLSWEHSWVYERTESTQIQKPTAHVTKPETMEL